MSEPTVTASFDPSAFGFKPDGSLAWFKRHFKPDGSPGRVVAHLYFLPLDGLKPRYSLNLGADLDTYYLGAIPDNAFAVQLFDNIAATLDPDEEADLIAVLLGNRSC